MAARRLFHFSLSGFVFALALILFPSPGVSLIAALDEETRQKDLSQEDTSQVATPQDNTQPHPILGDLAVRQALVNCTDRRALTKAANPFLTDAEVDQMIMTSFLPQTHWAYDETLPPYEFDPEAAAELLEQAGWVLHPGETIRRCDECEATDDGYELTFKLTILDSPLRRIWVPQLLEQWEENCGARVLAEYVPAAILFVAGNPASLAHRAYASAIYASSIQPIPNASQSYACASIPSEENGYNGFNSMGWCNPSVDEVLADEHLVPTEEALKVIYDWLQQGFREDVPSLPLFQQVHTYGTVNTMGGYSPRPYGLDTWNAYTEEYSLGALKRLRMKGLQPSDVYLDRSPGYQRLEGLIVDQPVLYNGNYEPEAHALTQLPTLESGLAQQRVVDVKQGDIVYSINREVVPLLPGERIRLADGSVTTYNGGTVQMSETEVRVQLREGLRWSDGTEITAADYELGGGAYCDLFADDTTSDVAAQSDAAQSDNVVDDFAPCPHFADWEFMDDGYSLTYIPGYESNSYYIPPFPPRPAHQIITSGGEHQGKRLDQVPFEDWTKLPEVTDRPLTTGPYRIVEWNRGEKIDLEANPFFRLGDPSFDEVTVRFDLNNAQAHQAIADGELDVSDGIGATNVPSITVYHVPAPVWEHVDFNLNLYDHAVSRVLPLAGGLISNTLGVSVTVPNGAISTTFTLMINVLVSPTHSIEGLGTPLKNFGVIIYNDQGVPITATLKPLDIEIIIDKEIDLEWLFMYHWDGTKWVTVGECNGCGVHPRNPFIIRTDGFSEFVVVGRRTLFVPSLSRAETAR